MKHVSKYKRLFFEAPDASYDWAAKTYIEKPPVFCSVDLRDGNQALVIPMTVEEKLELFHALVEVGFREIEVGFPAASETEFDFIRKLVAEGHIPEGVTIQVMTPAIESVIARTFDALKGAKDVIIHLYNSVSRAQREQVFRKSCDEVLALAVKGAELLVKYQKQYGTDYRFQYSPESFTATEPEFALKVCNAVLDVWQPTRERKAIINLPVTVELSMPHVYAAQVHYMHKNLKHRDAVVLSLHPHNDRGCAVADAELGLLAGGERLEGTLFGSGERTGNVDLVTVALNMYAQGVDPGLDLSDLPRLSALFEKVTRMQIPDRMPYAGKLVFAAFSGTHQDAIAKSLKWREEHGATEWDVPYLPIDPADIGREYATDVIRINAQSGKGGVAYILEHMFGYLLPRAFGEDLGRAVKQISDKGHRELSPADVLDIFKGRYVNIDTPLSLLDCHFLRTGDMRVALTLRHNGELRELTATGNGRLDAVSNALREYLGIAFTDMTYSEHALESGSTSRAVSYVSVKLPDGRTAFGVGEHEDIMTASILALLSALNRSM